MILWRDIPGYEGLYQISNVGEVRNATGRPLKIRLSPKGYPEVFLTKDRRLKHHFVHRLVAAAYIPNPEHLPEVNHRNGDKGDNKVANLEWCSVAYNRWHSSYVLQNESGKAKRPVVCLTTGDTYPTVTEAARAVSGAKQNITRCCQGKRKHYRGLAWAYAEEVSG